MTVGLYDTKISPFIPVEKPVERTRTRKTSSAQKKNSMTVEEKIATAVSRAAKTKYVDKNSAPAVCGQVKKCLTHMSDFRAEKFGPHAKLRNSGESYINTVLNILTGNNSFDEKLTADQFCDLYDFMLTHHFWGQFVKTPEGLKRNMLKMWNSDDYYHWSERENKPSANRPARNTQTSARNRDTGNFRGELKADTTYDYDYDYVSPEWDTEDNQ